LLLPERRRRAGDGPQAARGGGCEGGRGLGGWGLWGGQPDGWLAGLPRAAVVLDGLQNALAGLVKHLVVGGLRSGGAGG